MAQTIGSLDLNAFSDLYSDSTQYFWFEGNASATYGAGVHVTLVPDTSFINNPTGQNILMNTDGLSIRNGLLPMMTLDNDSLDFNTVDTTAGTYTNVASFGASSTIGVTDGTQSYMALDYHSLRMIDKEGDYYLYISDRRGENGSATLEVNFLGDGETTQFDVGVHISTLDSAVDSSDPSNVATVSTTNSRYVDFSTAPAAGAQVTIIFTTTDQGAKAYTLGTRDTTNDVLGASSVVLNRLNVASGPDSCASGYYTVASGNNAHSEGLYTTASGNNAHAEGYYTTASGGASHAEGGRLNDDGTITCNTASGLCSHAEGAGTTASNQSSHAEGSGTIASGVSSHAEGYRTTASGDTSHAEGWRTTASGSWSHAQNYRTIAAQNYQTVIGRFNIEDTAPDIVDQKALIIGNGVSENTRSNALTVDWDGNVTINNHSSSIGTMLSDVPDAVSCATGRYYQLAYLTLDAGVWMIDYVGQFPNTNATGIRDTFVTTDTSGYNNVTTSPSAYGVITRDRRTGAAHIIYCNAHFPVNIESTTTFRLIGYQNSGQTNSVLGRMYAVRIN